MRFAVPPSSTNTVEVPAPASAHFGEVPWVNRDGLPRNPARRLRSTSWDAAVGEVLCYAFDSANDDAAYDLELLLTRSKQRGYPIPEQIGVKKAPRAAPKTSPPGSGY